MPPPWRSAQADKSGHRSASAPLAVVTARTVADVQAGDAHRHRHRHPRRHPRRRHRPGRRRHRLRRRDRALHRWRWTGCSRSTRPTSSPSSNRASSTADFNEILAAHGFWFAPDPASKAISTVGGNIATNAGGLLCAKYGVTRDAVLGLKVVLADGRLLDLGHRSVKGVTGFDLTALMVGSEGLLGVIVEATVRIRRAVPGTIATIASYFPSVTDAAAAAAAITAAGIQPAVMELMDSRLPRGRRRAARPSPGSTTGEAHLRRADRRPGGERGGRRRPRRDPLRSAAAADLSDRPGRGRAAARRPPRRCTPPMERSAPPSSRTSPCRARALPAMFAEIVRIEQQLRHPHSHRRPRRRRQPAPELRLRRRRTVPELIWQAADELFRRRAAPRRHADRRARDRHPQEALARRSNSATTSSSCSGRSSWSSTRRASSTRARSSDLPLAVRAPGGVSCADGDRLLRRDRAPDAILTSPTRARRRPPTAQQASTATGNPMSAAGEVRQIPQEGRRRSRWEPLPDGTPRFGEELWRGCRRRDRVRDEHEEDHSDPDARASERRCSSPTRGAAIARSARATAAEFTRKSPCSTPNQPCRMPAIATPDDDDVAEQCADPAPDSDDRRARWRCRRGSRRERAGMSPMRDRCRAGRYPRAARLRHRDDDRLGQLDCPGLPRPGSPSPATGRRGR